MSTPIGFDKLFNADSFDKGTEKIAQYIQRISDQIAIAEVAAEDLTRIIGKELKKEIASLSSTSKSLSKDMQDMANKMQTFKTTTSNTKKVISDYEKENEKLRKELERLKTAQENVGKETKKTGISLKGLSQNLLGVASGAALVYSGIRVLKEQLVLAIKSTMKFEQAMKEVEAISRSSSAQIQALRENANKLGASTEKTAIQVAGLQKELAKLGFTSSEIIAASSAIVNLSTATGEDLAGSARVAAATLRAFGLDATEMIRVVDVMAGSFVRSGLDLEKFRESMKLLAPIAKGTNVDLETSTAALSKLADAGLSGSMAGTALRNLFSELSDSSSNLSKFLGYTIKSSDDLTRAFKDLSAKGVDLEKANGLVDVRAKSAFFILMDQAQAVENLAKEYKSLTGESEKLANIMRDTLVNDVEIANSAFDALRRNLVEGSTGEMRTATQAITTMVEALRLLSEGYLYTNSTLGELLQGLIKLGGILNPINNYLNMMKIIGIDLVSMWEDFEIETSNARDAFQEGEWLKKASGDLDAINKAIKDAKFDTLVNEYNKLSASTQKTAKDTVRLNQIEKELLFQYGETALAVDKVTGKSFLNIAAIERTIARSEQEAVTIQNTNKERLKEIDNKITLHRETVKALNLGGEWNKALALELQSSYEINRLLIEKRVILDTLGESLENVADTSKNGWSVYTEGASTAMSYAEFLRKEEEKSKIALEEKASKQKEANKILEERIRLEGRLSEERIKLQIAELEQLQKGENDPATQIALEQELVSKKIQLAQAKLSTDLEILDTLYKEDKNYLLKRKLLFQEFVKESKDISYDYVNTVDKMMEDSVKITDSNYEKVLKEGEKIFLAGIKNREDAVAQGQEDEEQRLKEAEEKKQAIVKASAQVLSDLSTAFFDTRQNQRDIELQKIDEWEQSKIRLAGDNEEAKLRIEQEAERRRRAIKNKQAQDNKKEAMFQIAINTAQGVMATIGKGGFFASPLAMIVAAIGAAQLAIVAAKPVPQFAKGTDDSPEGFAEVGERGRELIKDGKTGKWSLTPNSSTVTYLTKHSQVITNAETERILAQDHNSKADGYLSGKTKQSSSQQIDYGKIGQEVGKQLTNIPINITNFDQDGVTKYVMRRSSKITRLNKRY